MNRIIASAIFIKLSMIFLFRTVPTHDSLIGSLVAMLMVFIIWIKFSNAIIDVEADSFFAGFRLFSAMVSVPRGIEGLRLAVISEQHVLRVIVDQVALLFTKSLLGDKSGNS